MASLDYSPSFGTFRALLRSAVREKIEGHTYIHTYVCLPSNFNRVDAIKMLVIVALIFLGSWLPPVSSPPESKKETHIMKRASRILRSVCSNCALLCAYNSCMFLHALLTTKLRPGFKAVLVRKKSCFPFNV
ncbi:hypothetical protein AVEN_218869-1 [Araneus ventricosus]|uniref:Uncharacterized protein n=1 Tax=Araneus ventricosus TaxID=182803 RepID=A0A4Y2HX49_ARAVE|nr:hypothetical protein AVEN_61909-1 [Araneus ventricosus]GBM69883.1 hypothetical protein AVEN_121265-1 [Araneus ventricosus]GBM69923.1 hypothetical protein AVEN_180795-1 [Araneus ventricosus]GBM69942.1 hypothetical protein AVEN_218869-1 [Araneus ventricosus]